MVADGQFCRQANKQRQEEAASRERRLAARAALSPQPTGSSDGNLMESRLQRLKIEGTPRVKRERRAAAPPLSPTAETTDFSDFMLPSLDGAAGDDFGGAALRIYESIFSPSPEGTPSSPTPASGDTAMLGTSPDEPDADLLSGSSEAFPRNPHSAAESF